MKKRPTIGVFVLLAFVLPVTAYALLNWYEKKFEKLPVLGPEKNVNGKKQPHTINDFFLSNQDGLPVSPARWQGKIVVADFFFTYCASICPKMSLHMKQIQEACQGEKDLFLTSFTVDPERDNPVRLREYAQHYSTNNSNWDWLTGDKKEIYRLARNSFMIVATEGDGGAGDFIHSEKLVLVDKEKRIRGYYDGTSDKEVNRLIDDIKKLRHEE